MRVALFITCVNDTLFPGTGKAVARLFDRLGQPLEFPQEQTCCGQMHWNTGYRPETVPLAWQFVRAFQPYDAVVAPSGSCAAMVRTHYPRVAAESGDRTLAHDLAELAPRVYELSEFLVDVLGTVDVGAYFPHRVTYHPTCHSLRMLRVGDRPLQLLRAVRGLQLAELPNAEECCGFGGTFALKNTDTSIAMVADKVGNIRDTGADVVCAGDNSCLVNIDGTLSRLRSGVRAMHLAEILACTDSRSATEKVGA